MSLLEDRGQVELVIDWPAQHLHAGVSIDDLRRCDDELLVLEELVEEPDGRNLTKGYTSDVIYEHTLLPDLVLQTADACTHLRGKKLGFIGCSLVGSWKGFQLYI